MLSILQVGNWLKIESHSTKICWRLSQGAVPLTGNGQMSPAGVLRSFHRLHHALLATQRCIHHIPAFKELIVLGEKRGATGQPKDEEGNEKSVQKKQILSCDNGVSLTSGPDGTTRRW